MSTTNQPETDTCTVCGSEFDPPSDRGNYCSERCWFRRKGSPLINQAKSEASICSTCFGPVHETEVVPDHANQNANPKRFQTPRAVRAVTDIGGGFRQVWGCLCGDTTPGRFDGAAELAELPSVAQTRPDNLFTTLTELAARDAIPHEPDRGRYDAALEGRGWNLTEAAGYAVCGSD